MNPPVPSAAPWGRTLALVALLAAVPAAAAGLAAPFSVAAHGTPIDMEHGNAAPFLLDFDGDGPFDLLLGQRGECKLRIYRNEGSSTAPRFGASAWFKAGGVDASLPGG